MSKDDDSPIDPALLEAELARPLDAAILDASAPLLPPAGFADRVLAAQVAAPVPAVTPPSWRRQVMIGLSSAAVVLIGVFGLRALPAREAAGDAHPSARESIALGARGIAVAEAGAELRWKITGGRAEIEQTAGNVFYRVERGGPFIVHTPAGDVEVRGTCFSVEVPDMKIAKQGIIGAGVGAALTASVLVAVYEGKVSYANEHGQVAIGAGERATASNKSAPKTLAPSVTAAALDVDPAPSSLSREELVQRAQAQLQEIASLRARVQTLESARGAAGVGAGKEDSNKSYLNPTKEDLDALAKECRLRWDEPKLGLNPQTIGAEQAGEMGLSDAERQAMNKVNADFNNQTMVDLRKLYVELTGDSAGADALSPGSLIEELEEKSPRADVQAAFQRVARERAGLQAAPADLRGLPPIDRLMRLRTSLGDRYERELGAALGPDVAHKLREEKGGWGSRHGSSYGCPAQ